MTTTELELKTKRFTAKLNNRQVAKLHEIIEDILDARAVDNFRKRRDAGKARLIPMAELEAELKAQGCLK